MGRESGARLQRRADEASDEGPLADFVAIDFETANHRADSACAVGLVKVVGGRIVEAVVHLIRPPTREFRFSYIHGLEWADVAEADDFGGPVAEAGGTARRGDVPRGAQRDVRQAGARNLLRDLRGRRADAALPLHGATGAAALVDLPDPAARRLPGARHRPRPSRSAVRRARLRRDRAGDRDPARSGGEIVGLVEVGEQSGLRRAPAEPCPRQRARRRAVVAGEHREPAEMLGRLLRAAC